MQPVGILAILSLLGSWASAREHRLLSLSSLSSVLHSEVVNEFITDKMLERSAVFELEKQEAAYRRRLQEGDSSVGIIRFPALVCEHSPSMDAHDRGFRVSEGLNSQSGLRIAYNQDDMSCFQTSLEYGDLEGAPEELTIHPYAHPMKLLPDAIGNIMKDVAIYAHGGFDIDLCHGSLGDRLALVEVLESGFGALFDKDSRVFADLVEGFFWTNGENRRMLRENSGREETFQADLWLEAFSGSRGSEACLASISQLRVKESTESYVNFVYVEGAVEFVSSVASYFEDAKEGKAHGLECLLTVTAFIVEQPEVCHVGNNHIVKTFNTEASWILQSGQMDNTPFYDNGISGQGQVVAVSDSGLDIDNCYFGESDPSNNIVRDGRYDASKRKVVRYTNAADDVDETNGHGTHVVGTVCGSRADGQDGFADGVAKDAKVAFWDMGQEGEEGLYIPSAASDLLGPGYEAGARLHSASWGYQMYNAYTTLDYKIDAYLFNNDDSLFIAAAGNDGDWLGPNTLRSTGSPANAKNIVSVGATESAGNDIENFQLGYEYVADFSSRGPSADGRIKPDVVAPGSHILSAGAQPNIVGECDSATAPIAPDCTEEYFDVDGVTYVRCVDQDGDGLTFMQGTSMATPATSGAAALVRQYFMDGYYPTGSKVPSNALTPSGSLTKAVLVNSGREVLGVRDVKTVPASSNTASTLYDEHQGFGRVTLADTLSLGSGGLSTFVVNDQTLSRNTNINYDFTVTSCPSNSDFSVTLTWFDPTGTQDELLTEDYRIVMGDGTSYLIPACANCLVNDLDLKVIKGGTTYYPNGGSTKDSKNNVERVVIKNPAVGDSYRVNVRATNIFSSSQKFSLVASGCFDESSNTTPSPTAPMTPSPTPVATPQRTLPPTNSRAPSPAPITGEFCEIWVRYKDLHLDVSAADHAGEKIFDDPDIALAFRETVEEIAGAECEDESWVCFHSAGAARDTVTGRLRARNLQDNTNVETETITVEFVVTAKVEGSKACDDVAEEKALARQITARLLQSFRDGNFQTTLRSKGRYTYLSSVLVESQYFIPATEEDTMYNDRLSTERDRYCTNWEAKQWLQDHLWEIAAGGGVLVALCCLCGVFCAMCSRNRAKRREEKYHAQQVQMGGFRGKSPLHSTRPQPGSSSTTSMASMGYKGGATRNPSAAQRLAAGHGSREGPKGSRGAKKGKNIGRTVW